jgi:4'-phosphopantetheinyl transferase
LAVLLAIVIDLYDCFRCDCFSSGSLGNVRLKKAETHVIRANLSLSAGAIAQLSSILSLDEHERAACFHFAKHRRRFIACRGLLRSILGAYLRVAPADLRFIYGPNGKPGLEPNQHPEDVQFNLSHSEELALYAVARNVPIGVDVERLSSRVNLDKLSRNLFSRAQLEVYTKLPQGEKINAFFRCWTRKEAFIKAIGEGLGYPLDSFDVPMGEHSKSLTIDGGTHAGEWSIHHLSPAPGFVGAVAFKGKSDAVRNFRYEDVG